MNDEVKQENAEEEYVQFGDGPKLFVSDMSDEARQIFEERKIFVQNKEALVAQANVEIRRVDYSIIGCEVTLKNLLDSETEDSVIEVEE